MSFLKSRRFIIFAVIAFFLVLIFVITGCSQLSKKESTIKKNFSELIPELNLRYQKLEETIEQAETIGGERDVITDGKKQLVAYNKAKAQKDESSQLRSARELENIIGRLRANINGSPKLSTSEELKTSMAELEKSVPSSDITNQYKDAVKNFEKARTSWRLFLSALIGGYRPPQQLEFSTIPKN